MADIPALHTRRINYLTLLSEKGSAGANADERRDIRKASGHRWTAGVVAQKDDEDVNGHLCEWVGGPDGPKSHLVPTAEGAFWVAAERLAREQGVNLQESLRLRLVQVERMSDAASRVHS